MLEPRPFPITETNLSAREASSHRVEVTYFMTVTHFPLSLGWQLAAVPLLPSPQVEGIWFC